MLTLFSCLVTTGTSSSLRPFDCLIDSGLSRSLHVYSGVPTCKYVGFWNPNKVYVKRYPAVEVYFVCMDMMSYVKVQLPTIYSNPDFLI